MIDMFVPGGARLGPCPVCGWGGTVQIMSRAYYLAYRKWDDGRITGRCTKCGYEQSARIGRDRGWDAAASLLAAEGGQNELHEPHEPVVETVSAVRTP